MNIFLMPNLGKPKALEYAVEIGRILWGLGCKILLPHCDVKACGIEFATPLDNVEQCVAQCDVMIVIGGDGTIIHGVRQALNYDKPVLGINAGHLGFLAQAEHNGRLTELLSRLAEGKYKVEQRTVLSAEVVGGTRDYSGFAINDAVIYKGTNYNIVDLEMHCDGEYMDSFRGDGVIFATPTGSTAYSMSAGGPIIDHHMNAFVMTPICPHRLAARSLLFSAERKIEVSPTTKPGEGELLLSLDGAPPIAIEHPESIIISSSSQSAKFITFGEKQFYEILSEKIVQKK